MEDFFLKPSDRPGCRLSKLEVFNWGTFHSGAGQVYCVRPEGNTTLLVGLNGSGKSTLVDALLTLLVPSNIRNYNVAAGVSWKRERNERSYVKGAYGHGSSEDDNRSRPKYLRNGNGFYSCLLAYFHNEDTHKGFSIAQVLSLDADEQVHKMFCFSDTERSIARDLSDIRGRSQLRSRIERKGWKTTSQFKEYAKWFRTVTGMQEKAMDVFNQTVAVKDIRSLNDFIRSHMLEKPDWGKQIKGVLNHFAELSETHRSLVDIREQRDVLLPIKEAGESFNEQSSRLNDLKALKAAAGSYFIIRVLEILRPFVEQVRVQRTATNSTILQADQEIEGSEEHIRRLKNDIENAGGDRLKEIPNLIKVHEAERARKEGEHLRFTEALNQAEVRPEVGDANGFTAKRGELVNLQKELILKRTILDEAKTDLAVELRKRNDLKIQLDRELNALKQRRTNVDENLIELRRGICRDLGIPESDLPFAAELISVKREERDWESSIEMVLHSFGLSLLVPRDSYFQVSDYVERTHLKNSRGEGQRLVYLKVETDVSLGREPVIPDNSMLHKIEMKPNHLLRPWLQTQLERRFNYTCCESMDEFRAVRDQAMTKERHIKIGNFRHEKDDRSRRIDPGGFILGWDNKAKIRHLEGLCQNLKVEIEQYTHERDGIAGKWARVNRRLNAIEQALKTTAFEWIDFMSEALEISRLQREKEDLEQADDGISALKTELAQALKRKQDLNRKRDESIKERTLLDAELNRINHRIDQASADLVSVEESGRLLAHQIWFPHLDAEFAETPLSPTDIDDRERGLERDLSGRVEMATKELEPIRNNLEQRMNRFLRKFPQFERDMQPQPEYLGSFLDRFESIESEGLPKYEKRFKERLNDKVTQEIAVLNASLQTEKGRIIDKIEILNAALENVEFNPGTIMKLEPRDVHDREIEDFQRQLRECISGAFESSTEADEARYKRIEKLIKRLGEEERWRNKVSDVRRWFDFIARELDKQTQIERSSYSDSAGQSGGEKAKLAFTILVAAIAYQYDIDPSASISSRFHFVVVDEMFSKVDDQFAEYALDLFSSFGLQLLIVAPLDAKARVTERHVRFYIEVIKDAETSNSELLTMSSREFKKMVEMAATSGA